MPSTYAILKPVANSAPDGNGIRYRIVHDNVQTEKWHYSESMCHGVKGRLSSQQPPFSHLESAGRLGWSISSEEVNVSSTLLGEKAMEMAEKWDGRPTLRLAKSTVHAAEGYGRGRADYRHGVFISERELGVHEEVLIVGEDVQHNGSEEECHPTSLRGYVRSGNGFLVTGGSIQEAHGASRHSMSKEDRASAGESPAQNVPQVLQCQFAFPLNEFDLLHIRVGFALVSPQSVSDKLLVVRFATPVEPTSVLRFEASLSCLKLAPTLMVEPFAESGPCFMHMQLPDWMLCVAKDSASPDHEAPHEPNDIASTPKVPLIPPGTWGHDMSRLTVSESGYQVGNLEFECYQCGSHMVQYLFMIGAVVALSTASLCINQRPYHIVLVDVITKTRAEKRRDVVVGLAIGLGIPILEMILHYIVQRYRFNIFEEIECYPTTYNIPPPHALVRCWPTTIGVVSAAYCSQYPSVIWHVDYQMVVSLQMSQYLFVTCTFIFFSFFGFADEARRGGTTNLCIPHSRRRSGFRLTPCPVVHGALGTFRWITYSAPYLPISPRHSGYPMD
ncbi:pheromone A receptor-domain-containing protein [Pisolithus marmoratus]|nr:pheromone A receptor-domain-containing protein [Pisolithus marmoratus]